MARRPLSRRTIAKRLQTMEGITDLKKTATPAQTAKAKQSAIHLIGLLGSQRMVNDVKSGKRTVQATLLEIANIEGLPSEKRRIARMGARAASVEGF